MIHRKLVAAVWILAIGLLTTSARAAILLFFGIATTLAVSAPRRLNATPTPLC